MSERYGIDELTEVVMLALECVNTFPGVFDDEDLDFGDVPALWQVFKKLGPAVKGFSYIPSELKDLSLDEVDTLVDIIIVGYNVSDDTAKELLEKSLMGLKLFYDVYLTLKGKK